MSFETTIRLAKLWKSRRKLLGDPIDTDNKRWTPDSGFLAGMRQRRYKARVAQTNKIIGKRGPYETGVAYGNSIPEIAWADIIAAFESEEKLWKSETINQ